MYKAVIFDLDGTLLDSLNDILFILNNTLEHFGLPQITREQAKNYIGNGARELVRLAIGSENAHRLDEILAYYKKEYALSDNKLASLYDGEEAALCAFKERGVKIAILTNKPHAAAMRANGIFFKKFGFDLILGQTDGIALKPAPDAVYKIVEELRVKKEECLFVGDGETDVETAKNAGMDCVSVLWGYRTKEQLEAAGATRFAENFKKLQREILG
ncbi:MAG: HAD family hydrolase [Clostridia bacterium]|nr:HAD family hydrolase [Clostridia bacterium]